jgi:hypothetical protein
MDDITLRTEEDIIDVRSSIGGVTMNGTVHGVGRYMGAQVEHARWSVVGMFDFKTAILAVVCGSLLLGGCSRGDRTVQPTTTVAAATAAPSPQTATQPPASPTAASLPDPSLLRPGTTVDEVVYLSMDGSGDKRLALLSHRETSPDTKCGYAQRQDYLDLFERAERGWTRVVDSTDSILHELGDSCEPFNPRLGDLHVLNLKDDGKEQLGFALTLVAMAPRAPRVEIISYNGRGYDLQTFEIYGGRNFGKIGWPDAADRPQLISVAAESNRSFAIGLPSCGPGPCPRAAAVVGYSNTSQRIDVLKSLVDLNCEFGTVRTIYPEVRFIDLGCESFIIDGGTVFDGASGLDDLRIGDDVGVSVRTYGDPRTGVAPIAERVTVRRPPQPAATVPPMPPGELQLSPGSSLTWDARPDAWQYHVQRAADGEVAWSDVAVVGGGAAGGSCCSAWLYGLPQREGLNGVFRYRVYAENGAGRSGPSNEVRVSLLTMDRSPNPYPRPAGTARMGWTDQRCDGPTLVVAFHWIAADRVTSQQRIEVQPASETFQREGDAQSTVLSGSVVSYELRTLAQGGRYLWNIVSTYPSGEEGGESSGLVTGECSANGERVRTVRQGDTITSIAAQQVALEPAASIYLQQLVALNDLSGNLQQLAVGQTLRLPDVGG